MNNKIYKPNDNEYCFCCCTENNLPHMLNDSIVFNSERKKHFAEDYLIFVNYIKTVSSYNVHIIIKYIKDLFDKYNKM